ncbi:MAG: HTH domain-containing protein [Halieaceae bacterium]
MIANTTYYLDHAVRSLYGTNLGWDQITLIERRISHTYDLKDSDADRHYYCYDWVLSVRDSEGSPDYVSVAEHDLFEELGNQYKLTPTERVVDESDAAEPSDDNSFLNKGERRILDALRERTYKITADKLAAKVGLRRSTLYSYISGLRNKGFDIPEDNGRYILIEQDNERAA